MEFHFTLQYDLDNTKYQSIESLPSLLEFKTMVWLPHILTRTILESKEQGCQVNVRLDKSRKLFIKVSTPTSFLCYCSYALKQNIPIWPDYAVGLISLVWFAFIVWVPHTMVPPKTTTAHIQAAFLWVLEPMTDLIIYSPECTDHDQWKPCLIVTPSVSVPFELASFIKSKFQLALEAWTNEKKLHQGWQMNN